MSSISNPPTLSDPNLNIDRTVDNFSGGDPTNSDLAPAIVYTVVLALALPLLIWRLVSRKSRCREVINGLFWVITRGASLIMRAYMSRRQYGSRLLVAELILTSISPLFLINSLIDLWQRHMETKHHYNHLRSDNVNGTNVDDRVESTDGRKNITWVKIVSGVLKTLLLTAFVLALVAGVLVGRRLTTESQRNVINNLLKASYIMALAITVISLLVKLATHKADGRSLKKQALFYSYTVPLLVLSIYRVVQVFSSYRASSRTLVAFYVALILFEFIAYGILLATSIPKWFHSAKDHLHHNNEKRGQSMDTVNTAQNGSVMNNQNGVGSGVGNHAVPV